MTLQPPQRPLPARIFYSPDEPRLRAGWRILLQLLIAAALFVAISGLVGLVLVFVPNPPPASLAIASEAIDFLAVTVSVSLARRFLDRRTFASLGLVWNRQVIRDLLAGILIAGVMLGLIFLGERAAGWLRFQGFAWDQENLSRVISGTLLDLLVFLIVGWVEELMTRGYWLQNLAEGLGLAWGVIISSCVFAILHLANPNASPIIVVGLTAAGLFFAFATLRTRQLWLPIGLHIGWNFFEGTVFGFPVSGMASYQLIRQSVSGPELLTGGAFGPEAGAVLFPALLVGVIMIYIYTQWSIGKGKNYHE